MTDQPPDNGAAKPAAGEKPEKSKKTALAFPFVDRAQLAKLMGVHPDTVTDFTTKGMPVVTTGGHGRRSTYDAIACMDWWRKGQGKNAKEAAQTRAYEASAKLNELKLQRERGEVVSRAVVVREGQAYIKGWVTQVMALPRRAVQAGIVSREFEPPMTALCRDICDEINRWKAVKDAGAASKQNEDAG